METLKTRAEVLMSQLDEDTSFEKLAELFFRWARKRHGRRPGVRDER